MRYRLFFIDARVLPAQPVDLSRVMSVAFDSKDAAIERAREYVRRGSTVMRISGPEGFMMNHDEIISAISG